MDHGPGGKGRGQAIEDGEETSEQRDTGAGSAHPEEVKPADHDSGKETKAHHGAGLQKQAGEDAGGLGLEVGSDRVRGLQGAGPIRRSAECSDRQQSRDKEQCIERREEPEWRSGMLDGGAGSVLGSVRDDPEPGGQGRGQRLIGIRIACRWSGTAVIESAE